MTISRKRWVTKKVARRSVMAVGALSALFNIRSSGRPRIRAITYHRFGNALRDPFCVTRHAFEGQMRWLAEHGLAVSLDDVLAFMRGERVFRDGSVLVTIDDGYRSVYTEALPIMREYRIPAVAYVTTSLVGHGGVEGNHPEPFMTWDQIGRLIEGGVTIGSHAHTHRSLGQMRLDEAREEAQRSRESIERNLGRETRSFAYPFGMLPDHSRDTARVLAEAGYTTVFTSLHGPIVKGVDPTRLPRVKVEGGEDLWQFRLLCQGAMDVWRMVDGTLWHLQNCST
jgi:peptidoglycan/xylan/chitin deacetylase (PgdA/CDA1 family)